MTWASSGAGLVAGTLGTLAIGACTTVSGAEPAATLLQPASSVTSRFSADYENTHGGSLTFQTIQGTYNASCNDPAGSGDFSAGTEWYLPIGGYAGTPVDWNGAPMTGAHLALVENGSASCALTVYALSYTCAACGGTSYTSAASTPIPLGTSFAGSPATFTPPALMGGQDQAPFYANFYISAIAPWTTSPTIAASSCPTMRP